MSCSLFSEQGTATFTDTPSWICTRGNAVTCRGKPLAAGCPLEASGSGRSCLAHDVGLGAAGQGWALLPEGTVLVEVRRAEGRQAACWGEGLCWIKAAAEGLLQ